MGQRDKSQGPPSPQKAPFVPRESPPFVPRGGHNSLIGNEAPSGAVWGALELPSTVLEGCSVLLTTFPCFVNTFSHGAACPIWRSEGKAVTLQ